MNMIESLEGRALFSATGVEKAALKLSDDPQVAASLAKVQADRAAVVTAKTAVKQAAADGRTQYRAVAKTGKAVLAADRQAVKAARGDDAAVDTAKSKLATDRVAVRQNLTDAKAAWKAAAADAKAALLSLMESVKVDLGQLRVDVKAATQAERQKLASDVGSVIDRSGVTDEQVQAVVDKVKGVLENATPVQPATLRTLAQTVSAALADDTVTGAERDAIEAQAKAVLAAANVSTDDAKGIADDVRAIVNSANVTDDDLKLIADDVRSLIGAFLSATK
ncbi:MAG TPA: hypothetical protein VF796_05150 [Humisphaera sp.]